MNPILVACGAMVCLALGHHSVSEPASETTPDRESVLQTLGATGMGLRLSMVRVEYFDRLGLNDHTNTTCHIANTSLTSPISLDDVYVLGVGGIQSLIATWPGLAGVSVPPLGHVELTIDNGIPGVAPQTNPFAPSIARHVVFAWYGPAGAVELTSVITRQRLGNDDNRTQYPVTGVDLTP